MAKRHPFVLVIIVLMLLVFGYRLWVGLRRF